MRQALVWHSPLGAEGFACDLRGRICIMDEKKSIKLDFWKCIEYLRPKAAAVICLTVLLALGGFLTARFLIPPTYRAELLLYASNSGGPGAAEPATLTASDLTASKSLVDTCAALLDSRTLYEEVTQLSGPDGGYKSWHRRVTAASVEGSEVFRVYVTDRDPARAAAIANAVAEVFPGYVSGIAEGCSLHVVDRATVPEKRYAPSSAKYAALAGLLGAALSCAWVVMSGLAAELRGSAACAAYKGR